MVKRKIIAIPLIVVITVMLFPFKPAEAATRFRDLVAEAAVLAEVDTGTVLFSHNMDMRHPADSLAKIMTVSLALAAIENGETSPDEVIVMTESARFDINSRSTTQGISPGEEMTLLDLMYCAIVGSANEACNLIAEHIAGSVEAFVELMNERATELGCENTNFTNPHGQYNDNQYTTAIDQYTIFREATSDPLFNDIFGTFRHTVAATNRSDARRLTGTNSLVNSSGKYFYRPSTAGLASATFEGGYSFVALAEVDGMSLIAVVLGSDVVMNDDESADMRNLLETRRLFEWGFTEFGWRTILATNEIIAKAPIMHGSGADFVNLRPESEIRELLDKDIPDSDFIRTVTIFSVESGETLYAPITAGEVLGKVTITRGSIEYGSVLLIANTSIELHSLQFIRMQISDVLSGTTAQRVIWALVILIALYTLLVIRYNVLRIRRLRRIRAAKKKLAEERQHPERIDLDNLPIGKD